MRAAPCLPPLLSKETLTRSADPGANREGPRDFRKGMLELVQAAHSVACTSVYRLVFCGTSSWTSGFATSTGGGKILGGENFAGKFSPLGKVAKFLPWRNFHGV